jgi:hypothetical protein
MVDFAHRVVNERPELRRAPGVAPGATTTKSLKRGGFKQRYGGEAPAKTATATDVPNLEPTPAAKPAPRTPPVDGRADLDREAVLRVFAWHFWRLETSCVVAMSHLALNP